MRIREGSEGRGGVLLGSNKSNVYPFLIYTCKIQERIQGISMEDHQFIRDIDEDYCTELCAFYSLFVEGTPADGGKCVCVHLHSCMQ